MDDLANTSVVLSSDRTLILAEAVSKYVEWKINPPATLTMILIEHDEMNAQTWRIWYVLSSDQEKTMTILPSRAAYYHGDRSCNKQRRTIDV